MPKRYYNKRLLDLFIEYMGVTSIPRQYLTWSFLSTLGACLNDRGIYENNAGKVLYPNLYVLLVGPSGIGKDSAIDAATDLVEETKYVNPYYGKLTGAALADMLGRAEARAASIEKRPTIWLIFPELANSFGNANQADDFIKRLTAMAHPKKRAYQEHTRGLMQESGELSYAAPIIHAIFGSTQAWLLDTVKHEQVQSGLFARMFVVEARRNYKNRVVDPRRPQGWEKMEAELKLRLKELFSLCGIFARTKQCNKVREHWVLSREAPQSEVEAPMWERQPELTDKLAMLLSDTVQYGAEDYLITTPVWNEARHMVLETHRNFLDLYKWGSRVSQATRDVETVAGVIRDAGRIPHSPLLKRANHRGINAEGVKRALGELEGRNEILVDKIHTNNTKSKRTSVYTWAAFAHEFDEVRGGD